MTGAEIKRVKNAANVICSMCTAEDGYCEVCPVGKVMKKVYAAEYIKENKK